MANEEKYIKKIQMSDGSIYYIYDAGAPRKEELQNFLPVSGGAITGNLKVDQQLRAGTLKIDSIEYSTQDSPYDVLVLDSNGDLKKKSTNNLLEDIGGISYNMNEPQGILSFKYGRQPTTK